VALVRRLAESPLGGYHPKTLAEKIEYQQMFIQYHYKQTRYSVAA